MGEKPYLAFLASKFGQKTSLFCGVHHNDGSATTFLTLSRTNLNLPNDGLTDFCIRSKLIEDRLGKVHLDALTNLFGWQNKKGQIKSKALAPHKKCALC